MKSPRSVAEAENRLARFNGEKQQLVATVTRRVLQARLDAARTDPGQSLEYVLNDVAFAEIARHEQGHGRGHERKLATWRQLAHRLGRMSEHEKRRELERLINGYATDIAGNFNPRVYRFANGVLPPALSFLLAPIRSVQDGVQALGNLETQVHVEGEIDLIRRVADRGTLIFTPTHSSNLDSIVVGFGLGRAKLPPVTYGAGKNLFTNPFISYFMNNLGAYRVDRRLQFALYKDVLKEYSTGLLERGYHSLFFPGGTRCRSNRVEQKLKLGLLGTAVAAYENSLREQAAPRRIYVVPVTINYRLVLEAETLVQDYLADAGRSRFIIEDDEFSRFGRIVEFLRKLLVHDSAVLLRLGRPLDVFGNAIDDDGGSVDTRGRPVDPASYLRDASGLVSADPQRNGAYTRNLGKTLAAAFLRETVLLSTQIVCRAMFDAVRARTDLRDIYLLLRLPESAVAIPIEEVASRADRIRQLLNERPEFGRMSQTLRSMSPRDMVDDALAVLTTYHTRSVVYAAGDHLRVGSMKLLHYYANRTDHVPAEALS